MTSIDGFDDAADDFEAFAESFREVAEELPTAIDSGVQKTARTVSGTAKRYAAVDEGELRQEIDTERIDLGAWAVVSKADHAAAVEFGTDPHVIRADEADALAFTGRDGELVFRQSVEHPGTPAQPYLRPSMKEHQSELVENINEAINELFAEAFGI